MSWYRKYRPTTVSGLHLNHVREEIESMMRVGSFPHALLFSGPKGTGKTSAARVIAALLNDSANSESVQASFFDLKKKKIPFVEPSLSDDLVQRIYRGSSLVVSELDAASYRGIDDIRALRERLYLLPQEGNISVYVLDEVHMFTTEAWNALLKVLEEPPSHVVFILATTEFHKVPETITSRCRVLQFSRASREELAASLQVILMAEKIECPSDVLELIIDRAGGSFRDGVKMLEMVCLGKTQLTLLEAQAVLGGMSSSSCEELVRLVVAKDELQVAKFFSEMRSRDVDEVFFFESFVQYLHDQLMSSLGVGESRTVFTKEVTHFLLTALHNLDLSGSQIAFLSLELKLLELIFKAKSKNDKKTTPSGGGGTVAQADAIKPKAVEIKTKTSEVKSQSSELKAQPVEITSQTAPDLVAQWSSFVTQVSQRNGSLSALLRSSKLLDSQNDLISLGVYYSFHKEKLEERKMLDILESVASTMSGGLVRFKFETVEQDGKEIALVTPGVLGQSGVSLDISNSQSSETLASIAAEALM